jgi:hypothetical protein
VCVRACVRVCGLVYANHNGVYLQEWNIASISKFWQFALYTLRHIALVFVVSLCVPWALSVSHRQGTGQLKGLQHSLYKN